jgi:AMMECR1 domain-containing protein
MSKVPNPRFSFLSTNEIADLELEVDYLKQQEERRAKLAGDADEALRIKREEVVARARAKRIN